MSTSAPTFKAGSGSRHPVIAVVGNPNAGKTTLFNSLTGAFQKVGNYPGVTVERVSARLRIGGVEAECIDVPGLYSLLPVSQDEEVAVGAIKGEHGSQPDLLVCVVDAGNLERNLFFFSQIADLGLPTVVALTMVDLVEREGSKVDVSKLQELLGVDVVPVVGHKKRGIAQLREAIERNLTEPQIPRPHMALNWLLDKRVEEIRNGLARSGFDSNRTDIRQALLEGNEEFESGLSQVQGLEDVYLAARRELEPKGETALRYAWASMVQKATVKEPAARRRSTTDRIDYVLTHRVFGFGIFVLVMYMVFQSIYTAAIPLMDGIEWCFGWLQGRIEPLLEGTPVLQSLVVDGLIGGVGNMLVFLPQILILFFFIAMLEGTGYLARAAFLMDRLLGWCGLNGRAFIPLLSSFACAIPGIMAARVMPDPRSRLATILVAPLMSCSARLPVYLLLIGAFIEPRYGALWAGVALFAMHLLGLFVAVPIAWFLNRRVFRGKRLPFVLELPPYQWPKWRDVLLSMYFRGKAFVQTAGTIIVALSIVIWALSYFPRSDAAAAAYAQQYSAQHPGAESEKVQTYVQEKQLENSFLGRFGKTIEPVFAPAGFDWRLSTAILAAFPAREVVVSSLGILFSLGEEVDEGSTDLRAALQRATWPDGRPLVTPWVAASLMVFFALCCQCMATLATVRRETNSWR
ncbi:MAG TPA: ferrous iron transport protein B, partial [Fimbriimonadaceae bacterium]|nr:ferrous iron transport protein B [Fimbriimonadaceae bacterium]